MIADYWFAPTAAEQLDDYERYTCVIGPSMAGWSDLTVVPERLVSRLRDAIGVPQINTELEEFNRAFQDPRQRRAVRERVRRCSDDAVAVGAGSRCRLRGVRPLV